MRGSTPGHGQPEPVMKIACIGSAATRSEVICEYCCTSAGAPVSLSNLRLSSPDEPAFS